MDGDYISRNSLCTHIVSEITPYVFAFIGKSLESNPILGNALAVIGDY